MINTLLSGKPKEFRSNEIPENHVLLFALSLLKNRDLYCGGKCVKHSSDFPNAMVFMIIICSYFTLFFSLC